MPRYGNDAGYAGVLAPRGEEERQGLLGAFGQPGGILASLRPQPGLPRVKNFLRDRSAALMGFGLPLLLAQTRKQAVEASMQGLASGRATDAYRNKERTEAELRRKREQALATVLQNYGLDTGLSALPEVAQAAIVEAMKPAEQPDPFTLGPGQTRFGPDGRPLASVPGGEDSGYTLSPGQTRFGPGGAPIASVPATASADGPKLYTLNDEKGMPYPALYMPNDPDADERGFVPASGPKAPSGMAISFNQDTGQFEFRQGAGADLTPTTTTGVQKAIISAEDALAGLTEIERSFKPEYATIWGQAGNTIRSWRAWLTGSLPPEEAAKLEDYATWQATTAANMNEYLHEMSGAAISPEEAVRLIAALPNKDDDPITFKAKLDRVIRDTKAEIARNRARLGGPREGEDGWVEIAPGVRFRELP